jgi:4-amino-4-deoxy-L-arabinose transferase-like glycosyltransferase
MIRRAAMDMANVSMSVASGPLERAVAFAKRRPEAALAIVLGVHLVVWTLLPILVSRNLQLDLAEDLALGREWQLGYWKHPPLPWWLADLFYRIMPDVRIVYLLGPLSAVIAMYVVWRLAREVVDPVTALASVLALEGIHFFNFSVPKFAHDHTLLFLWPLTAWFFYRALVEGRARDWILAGASLALCFWSKYTAFAFAATLGLVLLLDPAARRAWRTSGPYLMALAFLIALAPHLWWLVESGFPPFRYVEARAVTATRWYQYLAFPLQWTIGQLFYLLPALGLLAIAILGGREQHEATLNPMRDDAVFARRYVAAIALGPFLVTTVAALVLGRLPIAMWGFALWSFAPLAILVWFPPRSERYALFARAWLVVFLAMPLLYGAVELFEPFVRDRPKATQFPGRAVAQAITRAWHEKTGAPLVYVSQVARSSPGAGEFAANNVAVYSPDRPHVIVHGDLSLSPWVDPADLKRRGVVLVWEQGPGAPDLPEALRARYPTLEVQPLLVLPRQTLRPVRPAIIGYAFVPPQP